MSRVIDALLGLIYPRKAACMGCGSRAGFPRDWLCEDCRQLLAKRWAGPGQPPPGGRFLGAAYAYYYGGPAGGLVRNLKYRGVTRLAPGMGRAMARAFEAIQPTGADCVVPVPMHKKRLRKRGFNHAALLAQEAGDRLGLPMNDALERVRNTRQQARLPDEKRRVNMEGAIALRGDVKGRRVILVDDVCTTGSTQESCAKVLKSAGIPSIFAVTLFTVD